METSLTNFIISKYKELYYRHTEWIKLSYLRMKYEKFYGPTETNPRVFAYTPTYNRGEILIKRAVESVINQSYKNFTYLVVGDCCTDNTKELMKKITDPRVHFYNLPSRSYRYPPTPMNHWFAGPVWASNYALNHVPNDCTWIARLDDDDRWTKNHLEKSLEYAISGNYEMVTALSLTTLNGKTYKSEPSHLFGDYYREPAPSTNRYFYNPLIGSISTLVYRSYMKFFKFNPSCWRGTHNKVNDVNLMHRLGVAGVRMGFIDKVHLFYNPRPGENNVGSKAYLNNPSKTMNFYKFNSLQ